MASAGFVFFGMEVLALKTSKSPPLGGEGGPRTLLCWEAEEKEVTSRRGRLYPVKTFFETKGRSWARQPRRKKFDAAAE
jgi:hypothetical protein